MAETNDCTSCRLISGFGFIGFGVYIGLVGTKSSPNPYSRFVIALLSAGFAGIGVARLCGLPPFSRKKRLDSAEKT